MKIFIKLHQNINDKELDESGAHSGFKLATFDDKINNVSTSVLEIIVKIAKIFACFLNHS